ncbi:DUF4833 domain-containing protein [Dyadobacter sp. NIV53]|uniref:DUF4833 domain-containing protein n=1 Tax=Dyadobacter sp. NIV53 TaxID=2861765 RepID=UPI001C87CE57|nr:DUF4833 domain-containing protein [Dyadobacter sp. NIV53]
MFPQQTIIRILTIVFILITPTIVAAQTTLYPNGRELNEINGYPVPSGKPDMLFYLQRSLDLNSVIYEAKYTDARTGQRKLDTDEPVNIYWLIHDKEHSMKPLSRLQRLGYGVRSESTDDEIVQLKLVAYREMAILLKPSLKENKYDAHVSLEGKDVLLKKVFINIDGGTKLSPNVTFIEITGTEAQTGRKIVHRIKP